MFRQIVVILATLMVVIISCQDLLTPKVDILPEFNAEVNGNLSIDALFYTDKEITHQQNDYEPLKMVKNVDGVLHYSIGARSSSE